MESVGYPAFSFAVCVTNFGVAFIKKKKESEGSIARRISALAELSALFRRLRDT